MLTYHDNDDLELFSVPTDETSFKEWLKMAYMPKYIDEKNDPKPQIEAYTLMFDDTIKFAITQYVPNSGLSSAINKTKITDLIGKMDKYKLLKNKNGVDYRIDQIRNTMRRKAQQHQDASDLWRELKELEARRKSLNKQFK